MAYLEQNTVKGAAAGASVRAGADVVTSIKNKDLSISTPNRCLSSAASGVMLYHSFKMSKKGAGLGLLIQGTSDLFAGELSSLESYAGGAFTSALTLKYLKDPSDVGKFLAAMAGSGVVSSFEMLGGVKAFSFKKIFYEMGVSGIITVLAGQLAKIKYLNIILSDDEWTAILDGLRRRFENIEKN